MNWPALSAQTSTVIADVLKDVCHSKPKDLIDHVAKRLEELSGEAPQEYERFFQECKRKPRTYVLEDRCPTGQDPLAWVPMRYNDDTILRSLQQRTAELMGDVLSLESTEDTKSLLDRCCVAFPELAYVREKPAEAVASVTSFAPAELAAFQTLRAACLACAGEGGLAPDDAGAEFSVHCEALVECARTQLLQPAREDPALFEALLVFCVLRALGGHPGFQRRYGGGLETPELAAVYAIEREAQALPSFARLAEHQKNLITASLQVHFPLGLLISTEAVPAHFAKAKDLLTNQEGALAFYVSCAATLHLAECRDQLLTHEDVDLVRAATQSVMSVEKYAAPRAYEMFLKKRAERHAWRLVRDDLVCKVVVRLCCLAGDESTEAWEAMRRIVEELPERQRDALKVELTRKDGLTESPAYVLRGGGRLLAEAACNEAVGMRSAVLLLARLLEEVARQFDHLANANVRLVRVDVDSLALHARAQGTGKVPFEDTLLAFHEAGVGTVVVKVGGR